MPSPAPASPAPPSPTPAAPLPALVCRAMVRDLGHGLPDPPDDTPAARAERDHAAIAEAALLAPADAGELRIALRSVSADAWANAYLRWMNRHSDSLATLLRLGTQATAMTRAANAARALLLRVQAQRCGTRRASSADPAAEAQTQAEAAQRAEEALMQAWHDQAEQLSQPLPKAPPSASPAPSATASTPPSAPTTTRRGKPTRFERLTAERRQQAEAAAAAGLPEPDWMTPAWRLTLGLPEPPPPTEAEEHRLDLLDAADRYAIIYPLRSRLIRRLGNLPPGCGIDPPEPELLQAIRTGDEANQRWADSLTLPQALLNAGRDREFLRQYEEQLAQAAPGGSDGSAPGGSDAEAPGGDPSGTPPQSTARQ